MDTGSWLRTLVLRQSANVGAKIRNAAKAGQPIPSIWATDQAGRPTTDPNEVLNGFLLPTGGHGHVVVALNGKAIAETAAALTLLEAQYPAIQYILRQDVDMTALGRSATWTYGSCKGEASRFSLRQWASARST